MMPSCGPMSSFQAQMHHLFLSACRSHLLTHPRYADPWKCHDSCCASAQTHCPARQLPLDGSQCALNVFNPFPSPGNRTDINCSADISGKILSQKPYAYSSQRSAADLQRGAECTHLALRMPVSLRCHCGWPAAAIAPGVVVPARDCPHDAQARRVRPAHCLIHCSSPRWPRQRRPFVLWTATAEMVPQECPLALTAPLCAPCRNRQQCLAILNSHMHSTRSMKVLTSP